MNDISLPVFILLSVLAIASSLMVITKRNLFHAAMFLGLFLMTIAGFYFLLDADLIGILQIFVYVGGVIVVLLFGIMLTAQITNVRLTSALEQRWVTIGAVAALSGLLIFVAQDATFRISQAKPAADTTALIGKLFLSDYILPFEVISILLLAALVGAVVIAREGGRS